MKKIYKYKAKYKAKPCAQGLALWSGLILSLVLFLFPAKTNAAVTIETFNSTPAGGTWTVPARVTSVDYLVVAGGGGGSIQNDYGTGGGGAGGMRTGTLSVTPGASLTVTVGAGGAAGSNGTDSVFSTITSTGGGKAGGSNGTAPNAGGSGGGGAADANNTGASGNTPSTSPSQGNSGGNGANGNGGGGGGGASATGATAGSGGPGGNGGAGTASSISGSSVTYAGGGGGGGWGGAANPAGGAGGAGGGGAGSAGAATPVNGTAGTANTGGGGGGVGRGTVSNTAIGGAGGAGIVILSYRKQIIFSSDVTAQIDLSVTGAISKGSGTFVIDHPLDPKNKLLFHSFVESPDVKNIYNGSAVLDKNGEAVIKLPNYFEALNKDFRYQAKPLGQPAPNLYIKQKIKSNKFIIAGGNANQKISWQVTGIRHDPYILANPIIPEVEKGPGTFVGKGEYLYPQVYESFIWSNLFAPISNLFNSIFH